jgi:hypothetical protein
VAVVSGVAALLSRAAAESISTDFEWDGNAVETSLTRSELDRTFRSDAVQRVEDDLDGLAFTPVTPLARLARLRARGKGVAEANGLAFAIDGNLSSLAIVLLRV